MMRPKNLQSPRLHKQDNSIHSFYPSSNTTAETISGKVSQPSLYCYTPHCSTQYYDKPASHNVNRAPSHFSSLCALWGLSVFSKISKGVTTSIARVSRLVVMVFLCLSCASCATKLHASGDEPIVGKTQLSFEQIAQFILNINPNFDPEIAKHYVDIGKTYGIRAEIAIAQAILETGWFEFKHGTNVKSDHHNYCGLGVTSSKVQGCCFDRIDQGVKAHIQHLFAYATDKPLPKGETLIDPRFKYVKRACAPSLSGLTGTWAMSQQYSKRILEIYRKMQEFAKKNCPEAYQ